MNLGKVGIAYPNVLYSIQVTHHTERKPTVMEWVLFEIAGKAGNNPNYKTIPLDTILRDLFAITDGDLLLRPVLIDLVDVNALEPIAGFSDRSDWGALRCGNLKLTESGRRLQKEGKFPAKAQNHNLEVLYDVTEGRARLCANPEIKSLSDNPIYPKAKDISADNLPGFPEPAINELIRDMRTGKNCPAWLQESSQIQNISSMESPRVMWRNVTRDLSADNDGNLSLQGEPSADIVESVLSETDFGEMPDYEIPCIKVCELNEKSKVQLHKEVRSTIDKFMRKKEIFLLASQFEGMLGSVAEKNCIMLGQPAFGIDDIGGSFIVKVPLPPSEGFCYQDSERKISSAAVVLRAGNMTRRVPYIYESVADFNTKIVDIVREYYLLDHRALKLLDFVSDAPYGKFYTEDFLRKKLNSPPEEILTPIDKIVDRIQKIYLKVTEILPTLPVPSSSEKIRIALLEKKGALLSEVNDLMIRWREALDELQSKTGVDLRMIDWQDTAFGSSVERMEQMADAVRLFCDDASSRYNNVYVMDTSALMHCPEILDYFVNNRAMVIIPKPVLVELDGLKKSDDEKIQHGAKNAIKKIDEYSGEIWLNLKEDNYEELLPETYKKAPQKGFRILSVALKYLMKQPVMVTDNINFRNFAVSEGVKATTVSDLQAELKDSISSKGKRQERKR